jgi:hypothetical protein
VTVKSIVTSQDVGDRGDKGDRMAMRTSAERRIGAALTMEVRDAEVRIVAADRTSAVTG